MGAKDSKRACLSYEDAVKRISDADLKRIHETFKRLTGGSTLMSQSLFIQHVLGDGVPLPIASLLYTTCGGTTRGIALRDLICGLVLLTKGSYDEKIKFLWSLYCNDAGTHIIKSDFMRYLKQESSEIFTCQSLFASGQDKATFEEFKAFLGHNTSSTILSRWLLTEQTVSLASNNLNTPTFYQTLAGVTHLEETDICDLEKSFWLLQSTSQTCQLDLTTLGSLISPPVPASAVQGLYSALDVNRDNHIDFKELCCGVSAACRGPIVERVKFCFKIFDLDQDGRLNISELLHMLEILIFVAKEHNQRANTAIVFQDDVHTCLQSLDTYLSLHTAVKPPDNLETSKYLTLESFLIWGTCSSSIIHPFLELLFQICHVSLGLRPKCRHQEKEIVLGWLEREQKRGFRVGDFWYLISSSWWKSWLLYTSQSETASQSICSGCGTKLGQLTPPGGDKSVEEGIQCDESFTSNSTDDLGDLLKSSVADSCSIASSSGVSSSSGSGGPSAGSATSSSKSRSNVGPPGPIDNQCLVAEPQYKVQTLTGEGGRLKLDRTLVQHRDFELIPDSLWKALAHWYGGPLPLPRQVIQPSDTHSVDLELYPLNLRILRHQQGQSAQGPNTWGGVVGGYGAAALSSAGLAASVNVSPRRYLAHCAAFSKLATVGQVLDFLSQRLSLRSDDLRLWHIKESSSIFSSGSSAPPSPHGSPSHHNNTAPLRLLDNELVTLQDLTVKDGDQILLEVRNADLTWPEELGALVAGAKQQDRAPEGAQLPAGATGLHNLGNTCFMNAALQAVSNTKPLTMYFRRDVGLCELNQSNPLGTRGQVARRYSSLLHQLWTSDARSIAPLKLRWCVARHAPHLGGGGQHDSQELLAWLLDALHEDLNRVTGKRYTELSDSGGRPDAEVAAEAWRQHLARDHSVARRYSSLLHQLWTSDARSIAPLKLRWCVARHAPHLGGGGQHDSQELLAWLLDALHEDLNRVTGKRYTELSDSGGRPDAEVAAEAWRQHLARDHSVITDLFYGQLKSKVTCQTCGNESVRFDPFNVLSLPLPMDSYTLCEVLVVKLDGNVPIKYGVRLNSESKYSELKERLEKLSGVQASNLALAEVADAQIRQILPDYKRVNPSTALDLTAYELEASIVEDAVGCGPVTSADVTSQPTPPASPRHTRSSEVSAAALCMPNILCFKNTPQSRRSVDQPLSALSLHRLSTTGDAAPCRRTSIPPPAPGCSAPRYITAIHRKCVRQDTYFVSQHRTRSVLFGVPLLLAVGPQTTSQELYEAVWTQVGRLLSPVPQSDQTNHAQDCDDSLGYEFPFTLRSVLPSAQSCSLCPWTRFCRGCSLPCSATPLVAALAAPGAAPTLTVAIDWEPTALHLRYQSTRERSHVEDVSVAACRRQHTEPVDLDHCLRAFTTEEKLETRYEFPFTLRSVLPSAQSCSLCPWTRFCRGCSLPCSGTPLVAALAAPGAAPTLTVAIDWEPTALHLRYQSTRERSHVEDVSVAACRRQHTEPVDLDHCLRAFTTEEKLETRYEFPFTLRSVLPSAQSCSLCPWTRFCRGCSLPCSATPLVAALAAPGAAPTLTVAIDWEPTALHLRYQSTRERSHVEDGSVAACRRQHTEPVDLDHCLRAFTTEEKLETRYHCSRCQDKEPATKKLQIWRLPPVLIIHLKRFDYVNNKWVKTHKVVNFPFNDFDPTGYLASVPQETILRHKALRNPIGRAPKSAGDLLESTEEEPISENVSTDDISVINASGDGVPPPGRETSPPGGESLDEGPQEKPKTRRDRLESTSLLRTPILDEHLEDFHMHHLKEGQDPFDLKYQLYAVVSHSGMLNGGHYISYACNPNGSWYCYNDSSCREVRPRVNGAHQKVNLPVMDTSSAYMLFYEREGLDYAPYLPELSSVGPMGVPPVDLDDGDDSELRKQLCNLQ